MKQTHSSALMMRNPGSSSRRSSDTIKQWSSRPIACFVRGGPSARVELLARHISTKSRNHIRNVQEIALIPNTKFRPRIAWQLQDHPCSLNPRSALDRDCQHAPLSKDMAETRRSSFSISSRVMSHAPEIIQQVTPRGVFHIHSSSGHGSAREDLQNEIMPLVTLYRCDAITGDRQQISEHLQQTPARLQSSQRSCEHPHERISENKRFATRGQNGVCNGDTPARHRSLIASTCRVDMLRILGAPPGRATCPALKPRQAAEHPLSPSSLLYVLYVLYILYARKSVVYVLYRAI